MGATATAGASAATPVRPVDLSAFSARGPIVDTIVPPAPIARAARTRSQTFTDQHGHNLTMIAWRPSIRLESYADVLGSTLHGSEINRLVAVAARRADMAHLCQSATAVACYTPAPPGGSAQLRFAVDAPDVVHALVHEYGHHVDHQLVNLGPLGRRCAIANDGSRNWLFERGLSKRVLRGMRCAPRPGWDRLLGQIYAEDYVALNRMRNWVLPGVAPPSQGQLEALASDFAAPFVSRRTRWSPYVGRRGSKMATIRVTHWTFLHISMRGPRGTDFDLALYRGAARRPMRRNIRRGSRAKLSALVAPGTYALQVYSYIGKGKARFTITRK